MNDIEDLIAQHQLFRGLSPHHIAFVASCGESVGLEEGEQVFLEGEAADHFWLIRHGRVALQVASPGRGQLMIETLHGNDVLGWSWMVPPYCWHFDAEALEPTRAVRFDAVSLRHKFDSDAPFGYELLRRFMPLVVERLQATRLRLVDLYGNVGSRA